MGQELRLSERLWLSSSDIFAHRESAKIHRLDGPAKRTANECNSRSRHSGRSGRERVLFHLVLRSDLHRTLDTGCTACHSWPATKRVRMDYGRHLRQRNCCDGYRCLARLSAPSEDDNPPHTMTVRFQVAIDVEKSSSHHLSQIEIDGDNPCSQQLTGRSNTFVGLVHFRKNPIARVPSAHT